MKYLFSIVVGLIAFFGFAGTASATNYYIDFTASSTMCGNPGTATRTPYCSLDQFTETARSAGDIAFVRRGKSTTTGVTTLTFTSDGSYLTPIVISADNDNLWGDFATSSQTATLAYGSTTIVMSASTTGIVSGSWIYVEGDCRERLNGSIPTDYNNCDEKYEVYSVATNTLVLYEPYRGNNAGSGKYLVILPYNPIWSTDAGTLEWNFDGDSFWTFDGLWIRGSSSGNGVVDFLASAPNGPMVWRNVVMTSDNSTSNAMGTANGVNTVFLIYKSRFTNFSSYCLNPVGTGYGSVVLAYIERSYFRCGSGIGYAFFGEVFLKNNISMSNEFVIDNVTGGAWAYLESNGGVAQTNLVSTAQNLSTQYIMSTAKVTDGTVISGTTNIPYVAPGVSTTTSFNFYSPAIRASSNAFIHSSTTNRRTGGGNTVSVVFPGTILSTEKYRLGKLFEYPVYTDTTSRTYSVYFKTSTSTGEWTANPSASELWVECEFWDFPAGATSSRRVKKSTGTVNFTGSSAWQALSVTCQPSQSGTMYLRGWYGKPRETNKTNSFVIDNYIEKS